MEQPLKFPIAEIFTSFQGEGLYAGTPMTFIRFAGCNVGKRYPASAYEKLVESSVPGVLSDLPIYTEKCTSWDGREFACDTDYRVKERLTVEEIIAQIPKGIEHICLTGGEPLMRGNLALIYEAFVGHIGGLAGVGVHIETSGTRPIPRWMLEREVSEHIWITVSPKLGFMLDVLLMADEIKFLVDKDFREDSLEVITQYFDGNEIVWLSPINGENELDKSNQDLCKKIIMEKHPTWRLATQMHKIWGVR